MRYRIIYLIAGLSALAGGVASCGGGPLSVRGSGNVVSEAREVSGFDKIALDGSGTVRIEVTGSESLTIEAEDNLLPYLTSDVDEGTLELGSSRTITATEEIVYTIEVVSLAEVRIGGSGDVTVPGVSGDRLEVDISGSGSFESPGIEVDSFVGGISGSGGIEVSGAAGSLDVSISGSGAFAGADLTAKTGSVSISGSGDATVNVTDRLEAEVSGLGDIVYFGNPELDAETSGLGNINQAR